MKLIKFAAGAIEQGEAIEPAMPDRQWQRGCDRVFVYLRCLDLPATTTLELALRALRSAQQKAVRDCVAGAMQSLQQILRKPDCDYTCYNLFGRRLPGPAAPPICRLPMRPEGLFSKKSSRAAKESKWRARL
jgi:hypothetical protein